MKCYAYATVLLCLFTLATLNVTAQRGDRKGHDMPEVWRDMNVPDAPVLTPTQALKTFKVAPGFKIELVASEPLIEDPVALTYDPDGRIWVVEMRGYMPNVDGKGETELKNGRISVLEDIDGDGKMDKATRFLEGLIMPRAVTLVKGGVLVAEPPHLWFCEDTDGDLKCDKKTKVANYAKQGPVEHTENALMYGLDNWIYNAKSSRRFQFTDGKIIEEKTNGRGQWGLSMDNFGRIYHNGNSSYLHADLVPAEYLQRNPHYPARTGMNTGVVRNQTTYSIRVNPGINRGYQKNMLKPDGRLSRTTAVSGQAIYRGDQYPDQYTHHAFVPEPSGNLVAAFKLKDDGLRITGEQLIYDDSQWEKRAFLASTDERFRPVDAYSAPDGTIHIVDMYRGILQHKVYVTSFLRKQILERKLDKPIGLGRIYRIVHESSKPRAAPKLSNASSSSLVNFLAHKNGWYRDTAQRLLVERQGKSVISSLRTLAATHTNPLARIHALWTLHGLNAVDFPTIKDAIALNHTQVTVHAMRVGEALKQSKDADAFAKLITEAGQSDSIQLKVQALYSLSGTKQFNAETIHKIAANSLGDQFIREAIISGLNDQEITFTKSLLGFIKSTGNNATSEQLRLLKDLSQAAFAGRNSDEIAALFQIIADQLENQPVLAATMIEGVLNTAGRNGPKPVDLKVKPPLFDSLANTQDKKLKEQADKLVKYVQFPGGVASAKKLRPLNEQELKLMEIGQGFYSISCIACHQAHGGGQPGMAPTLIGTDWVNGSEERLVRVVLQGLQGEIEIEGEKWNLIMPPHGINPLLNDERIAGILTYIRRSWDNTGDPVKPETVQRIREATKDRQIPWTAKELEKFTK